MCVCVGGGGDSGLEQWCGFNINSLQIKYKLCLTLYSDKFENKKKIVHFSTEDCKLVVRLQMQNTLGIVVIGQLDE